MTRAGGGEIPRVTSVGRYCEPDCGETTLTSKSITVQITTKGQVTIPREIRNRLGLLPHTKVEFEMAGDHALIRKARRPPGESVRGRLALDALRGTAATRMSTDEILALTRGETRAATRRK
jgi:AbrB family looped-hinge helix DNA binding protein